MNRGITTAGTWQWARTGARGRVARAITLIALAALLTSCGSVESPTLPPTATSPQPTATATPLPMVLKPCTLPSGMEARCGTYTVFEDRASRSGRTIGLRVALVKARSQNPAPDPMIYLSGGPGGAATEDFTGIGSAFISLNEKHDWLLVDQRGTGGSNRLLYPPVPPEALNAKSTQELEAALKPWLEKGVKVLNGDPRFYTTALAVDDIDEVAQSLGYKQVNLYGGSYGATAVQYYLRQHGDHVRTAIMDGGTLVDIPIFERLAPNAQRALDLVFKRCEGDKECHSAYPDVRNEMQAVFDRLGKGPVTVESVTDPSTKQPFVFYQEAFAEAIRTKLLNAAAASSLPRLIHEANGGDFSGLAGYYVALNAQYSQVLRQVMYSEIRCSESWAKSSPNEVARLGKGTYFVGTQLVIARQLEVACKLVPKGVVPADDSKRARSNVPVLILVGEVDPQDPESSVADAQRELPNSLKVIVPGHGHGVIQMGCLHDVAAAFVDSGTVKGLDTSCVKDVPIPLFDTGY